MTLQGEHDRIERMFELLNGFAISQIVVAAAQLELAAHLKASELSLEQLAARTGTRLEPLRRLVDVWCALGMLQEDRVPGAYRGTPLLELLAPDHAPSLAGMARLFGVEYYRAWGELLHTVRTGRSAFEHHHGASLWSYLAGHERAAEAFGHAMSFNAGQLIARVLEGFDFSGAGTIVDVGAANGELLAAVLSRYPETRGVAFDLPRIAGRSPTVLEERGLAGRCEVVTGDFFASVPAGGDLYVLKAVLHNWDDEHALQILRNCQAAMSPGARLLVIESPGQADQRELSSALKDLWMMVLFGGRERTAREYVELVQRAGFAEPRILADAASPVLVQAHRR